MSYSSWYKSADVVSSPFYTYSRECLDGTIYEIWYPEFQNQTSAPVRVKRPGWWKRSWNTGKFIPNTFTLHEYTVGSCRTDQVSVPPSHFRSRYYDVYNHGYGITHELKVESASEWLYDVEPLKQVSLTFAKGNTSCTLDGALTSRLASNSVTKAYANMLKPDFAGLGELGEIKETLEFLRHPTLNLVKLIKNEEYLSLKQYKELLARVAQITKKSRDTKTWNWARWARELPDALANDWLSMRYAMRPLLMSISDIIDTLEKQRKKFDPDAILCARSKIVDSEKVRYDRDSKGSRSQIGLYPVVFYVQGRHSVRRETVVRGGVNYKLKVPIPDLQRFGLAWKYVPETAWELTKWTFILDWIIDFGSYIESFRFNPEAEVLGTFAGLKTRVTSDNYVTPAYFNHWTNWRDWEINSDLRQQSSKTVVEFYERKIDVSRRLLPQMGSGFNLAKAADVLAIAWRPLTRAVR